MNNAYCSGLCILSNAIAEAGPQFEFALRKRYAESNPNNTDSGAPLVHYRSRLHMVCVGVAQQSYDGSQETMGELLLTPDVQDQKRALTRDRRPQ